jgi:hypothetical protein
MPWWSVAKALIIAVVTLTISMPTFAQSAARRKQIEDILNQGYEVCLHQYTLAPGVVRNTDCRKTGTSLYTKVEVSTRRDAVHWVKATVFDNGWPPTVEICRTARASPDVEICRGIKGIEAQLLEVQESLDQDAS